MEIRKILTTDEGQDIVTLLTEMMRPYGYECLTATTGADCLWRALEEKPRIGNQWRPVGLSERKGDEYLFAT